MTLLRTSQVSVLRRDLRRTGKCPCYAVRSKKVYRSLFGSCMRPVPWNEPKLQKRVHSFVAKLSFRRSRTDATMLGGKK